MSYFGDIKKRAICHPDRKHHSKGMCLNCYRKMMNTINNKKYQKIKKSAQLPSSEYLYLKSHVIDVPDLHRDGYWIDQDCKMPRLLTV